MDVLFVGNCPSSGVGRPFYPTIDFQHDRSTLDILPPGELSRSKLCGFIPTQHIRHEPGERHEYQSVSYEILRSTDHLHA